jgi:hypothetical protein
MRRISCRCGEWWTLVGGSFFTNALAAILCVCNYSPYQSCGALRLLSVRIERFFPWSVSKSHAGYLAFGDQQELTRYPLLIQYETVPELRAGSARSAQRDFVIFRGGGFSFRVKVTNRPLTAGLKPFAIVPGSAVRLLAYSFVETPIGRSTVRTVKETARRFGS